MEWGLSHIPEILVFALILLSGQPLGLEEQLGRKERGPSWHVGRSLAALVWGKGPCRMSWEVLTKLLDSSKGRKPTLILRTQLSMRVNAILGECVRASVSSPVAQFLSGMCWTMDRTDQRQNMWPLPIPSLTFPSRAKASAAARL